MHLLINKYKLYLYLLFFVSFASIFNFQIFENIQSKFKLKTINIYGLSSDEKKIVNSELNHLLNKNIFEITEKKVLEKLNDFNFLENVYATKVIPSTININFSKTTILGKTLINGQTFYLGKNGKFINSNHIFEKNKIPSVFGNFKINQFLNLLKILKDHDLNISQVDEYYFYKNNRWDILFFNGLTLKLPSKNVKEAIKIYKKLLNNNNLINIKIIDLRVNNQIILTKNNE